MTKKELIQLLEGVDSNQQILFATPNFHSVSGGVYELSIMPESDDKPGHVLLSTSGNHKVTSRDYPYLEWPTNQIWDGIVENLTFMSFLYENLFDCRRLNKEFKPTFVECAKKIIEYIKDFDNRLLEKDLDINEVSNLKERDFNELYKAFMMCPLTNFLLANLLIDRSDDIENVKFNDQDAELIRLKISIGGKSVPVEQIKTDNSLEQYFQWEDNSAFDLLDTIKEIIRNTESENEFSQLCLMY